MADLFQLLPQTQEENDLYREEYARGKRIRAGTRGHVQFIEIYGVPPAGVGVYERFKLFGVEAIAKARRAEAGG
jgi:hypothetical protein